MRPLQALSLRLSWCRRARNMEEVDSCHGTQRRREGPRPGWRVRGRCSDGGFLSGDLRQNRPAAKVYQTRWFSFRFRLRWLSFVKVFYFLIRFDMSCSSISKVEEGLWNIKKVFFFFYLIFIVFSKLIPIYISSFFLVLLTMIFRLLSLFLHYGRQYCGLVISSPFILILFNHFLIALFSSLEAANPS